LPKIAVVPRPVHYSKIKIFSINYQQVKADNAIVIAMNKLPIHIRFNAIPAVFYL
jgi:hypothetical protein